MENQKQDNNIQNVENVGDVSELRRDYHRGELHRREMPTEPLPLFRSWLEDAVKEQLCEPNAMTLATADGGGAVSARTVLLKAYDERGFVFFTNYGSRKAAQLAENAHAALLFAWLPLERQVEIEGRTEKISAAESAAYFLSRPLGNRVGAWVSQQSKVISSRMLLEEKFRELMRKFREGEVPKPDFWGGYRVVPERVEFWQGGSNRIHDRFLYSREETGNGWKLERLQP